MVKENKALIFAIGFICAWLLFSVFSKRVTCQPLLPANLLFSGESNVMYFLDKDNAIVYRYDTQGRMTRKYVISELGKHLKMK
ncbi:MAG: hypothetical protein ABH815_04820 [Candidatus Omnitrophota bacterium]